MRRTTKLFAGWLLSLLFIACDPPVATDTCANDDGPIALVDGGIQCGLPFDPREPGAPAGRWAVKVVQYIHLNAAGIVETDAMGWAIGYTDLSYEPSTGEGILSLKLCHLEIPQIQIPGQPQPAIFSIDQEKLDQYVDPGVVSFSLSGEESCSSIQSGPAVILVAARLKNRLDDPLPWDLGAQFCTGPDADGCHYDADGDGRPGATIRAQNIPVLDIQELFATLRAWVAFDGIVASPDVLLGAVTFGLDLQVLGCDIAPLGGGAIRSCNAEEAGVLVQITPSFTPASGPESNFIAKRVSADMDCPTVIAQQDQLFGR